MSKTKDPFKEAEKAAKDEYPAHVIVLMDESGSMQGLQESVISGVNRFVGTFRKRKSKTRVSLAWFDKTHGEPVLRFQIKAQPVKNVKKLTAVDYVPRGGTPLYDAVLGSLDFIAKHVAKGEVVFFAIITDGQENASEATRDAVRAAIKKAEKKGWGIVFLGANIDAQAGAQSLGLAATSGYSFTASKQGVNSGFAAVGTLGTLRSSTPAGVSGQAVYAAQSTALHNQTRGVIPEADEDEDDGS